MIATPIGAPNPNRQPTTGLVALAVNGQDEGARPGAWEAGFVFDSETCSDGLVYAAVCQVDTEKTVADNPPLTTYLPVTVVGVDACSTLDPARDREGRARRHLLAVQSHQLAKVFWTGAAVDDPDPADPTDPDTYPRPHLASLDATVLASGAATAPADAVALLDQATTGCLHGTQGMVHVTPFALAKLAAADLVHLVQGRWHTPGGHLVVADSGYPGTGPRDPSTGALPAAPDLGTVADQWAYATAMVTVLLGAVDIHADIDRAVNTHTVRAERPAAAFHGACCHYAIQLDFTPA